MDQFTLLAPVVVVIIEVHLTGVVARGTYNTTLNVNARVNHMKSDGTG